MNGIQTFSIRETRAQLSDIVNQVAFGHKTFVITKFGKPKAIISAVDTRRAGASKATRVRLPGFGIWTDRADMKDAERWVEKQRKQWALRFLP